MKQEVLTMSRKEIERVEVINQLKEKKLSQKSAAAKLGISDRQVRRLRKRYNDHGLTGLISRHRGKRSVRKISDERHERIMAIVSSIYADFGPTLAAEKLKEDGEVISRETLRLWMTERGLWKPKSRKEKKVHQSRERRPRFGELIQIDGSPHDWFEGRREPCTLLVFIDDATGEFMQLRFEESETTEGYAQATRDYIAEYGIPLAFYSDRHGIFKINHEDPQNSESRTQFGRMAETLGIELIYASTPQAKGRVERANQTLQDRLVKELRLRNISTLDAANEFLKEYKYELSNKFAVEPKSPVNAHRPLLKTSDELDIIFTIQAERTVSKNLEIRYENTTYKIESEAMNLTIKGAKVTICKQFDGRLFIIYKGKKLPCYVIKKPAKQIAVESAKTLNKYVDSIAKKQSTYTTLFTAET